MTVPWADACHLRRWRWSQEGFVAIKVNASIHYSREGAAGNESSVLRRISQMNPRHEGWHFVRKLIDSFSINDVSGKHICLVFEPLREPLWLYCRRYVGDVLPLDVCKVILQMILHGLDYLHSECEVIHAGTLSLNLKTHLIANQPSRFEAGQCHGKSRRPVDSRA